MTDEQWRDAGYGIELLGPGMSCWSKYLPNGRFIWVDGATVETNLLPPLEDGPWRVGLYLPQAEEATHMIEVAWPHGSPATLMLLKAIEEFWLRA